MDWLHFIGKTYYPTTEAFADEARKYGISRRIDKRIMQRMNFGDRVFLFQKIEGRDYSKMFGYFVIDRVLGSNINEIIRTLNRNGKVDDSKYEEREIYRRCGLYKITAEHNVEITIPDITEMIAEFGAQDVMIGGEFQGLDDVYSEISFQQGFRQFDYKSFEQERQKGIAEGKRDGSMISKKIKGYFYGVEEELKEPPRKGKIMEVVHYVKKPVSKQLTSVFEERSKEFFRGKLEVESIPREKIEQTIDKKETSFLVDVFYGTDRKRTNKEDLNHFYGSGRDELQYGICKVHIPPEMHKVGKIERPKWWKLQFKEDLKKHFKIMDISPKTTNVFNSLLSRKINSSTHKDAFVFVHGYNVNFAAAAMRTAQIAFDLGFEGAPMMFSWPSQGSLKAYIGDNDSVNYAKIHLKEFLVNAIQNSGSKRIHVIAHSMGNECLTRAIEDISEKYKDEVLFNNIILAAPDIDRDIFVQQIAPNMTANPNNIKRITLYVSSKDLALRTSKVLRSTHTPRVGMAGEKIILIEGIDTIDASAVDTDFLGHGYIANSPELINDLAALIKIEPTPSYKERNLIEKEKEDMKYWSFTPPKK